MGAHDVSIIISDKKGFSYTEDNINEVSFALGPIEWSKTKHFRANQPNHAIFASLNQMKFCRSGGIRF